jgi:hypothetical protein
MLFRLVEVNVWERGANMHKDLFVRRIYTKQGISVAVEIDFVKKTVSLVEKDGQNKKWIFADRTVEYMNGWSAILRAMDYAVQEAKKELDKVTEQEHEDFVKLYMELDKTLKKGK